MTDDELRERVARALYDVPVVGASYAGAPSWEDADIIIRQHYRDEATAALAAARPVIRAQALEAAAEITVGCCIECYAAIRALIEDKNDRF